MSLRAKFITAIMILLFFLVAAMLFLIERREEKAIFEEQKSKGVLTAKNIAYLNLEPFMFWDAEGVERNIQENIDQKLLYVAFFDQYNRPFAASDFAEKYEQIFKVSHLKGPVDENTYFFQTKEIQYNDNKNLISVLEIEVPVFTRGSSTKWGSIKIGLSLEDMQKEIKQTRFMLILIGLGGLLVGIGGAVFLSNRIAGPIKKLVDGTVRISRGDFSKKIKVSSQDEIRQLAESFNEMSRQLLLAKKRMEVANKKLIQAEKLASIGRISASIAHEIRNPLTSANLNIQKVLQSDKLEELEREHLDLSQEGIGHIEKFIKELLDFTRISELNMERFSIQEIIEESVKMISDSLEEKKIKLRTDFQENLPSLYVDGDKIRQVILNLLRNALEAVDKGGRIQISATLLKEGEKNAVKMEVMDNGSGIPNQERENIFEPFYTTKSSGIGLGLANAQKIIEQHQGSIRVKESEEGGACFEIILPVEGDK
ncbi:MAG: HAMP domain-containing protein [Candidatus Aminicenantes bacterium]|nr:HAMP domain-containing protein [Candidatus Aminicenantes bacterium]